MKGDDIPETTNPPKSDQLASRRHERRVPRFSVVLPDFYVCAVDTRSTIRTYFYVTCARRHFEHAGLRGYHNYHSSCWLRFERSPIIICLDCGYQRLTTIHRRIYSILYRGTLLIYKNAHRYGTPAKTRASWYTYSYIVERSFAFVGIWEKPSFNQNQFRRLCWEF